MSRGKNSVRSDMDVYIRNGKVKLIHHDSKDNKDNIIKSILVVNHSNKISSLNSSNSIIIPNLYQNLRKRKSHSRIYMNTTKKKKKRFTLLIERSTKKIT